MSNDPSTEGVQPLTKPIHLLASLAFNPDVHVHGYMMTTRGYHDAIDLLVNVVTETTEKNLGPPRMPMMCVTLLDGDDSVKKVREAVLLNGDEAKNALETATDFHLSVWLMKADDPLDAQLMEIH